MPVFEGLGDILRRALGARTHEYAAPEEEPPGPVCETCGGSGWVTQNVPLADPNHGQAQPCMCRPAVYLQTFLNFHIDARFPKLGEARFLTMKWAEGLSSQPILLLNAERGRGKSHLSKAAANTVRQRGQPIEWTTHGGLLDRLHSSFDGGGTGALMALIETARWMVIDDLGQATVSPTMEDLVDRIIDKRSEAAERGCRTLFTTNLRADQFSERTESRLRDVRLVKSFTIDAPDFRLNPIGDSNART
ncbi:MAG: ATP-binding protein [Dehalococcoidia bacterium]